MRIANSLYKLSQLWAVNLRPMAAMCYVYCDSVDAHGHQLLFIGVVHFIVLAWLDVVHTLASPIWYVRMKARAVMMAKARPLTAATS